MKQKCKGGWEYDLLSKWRKQGILIAKPGAWKYVKTKMNRRHRRDAAHHIRSATQLITKD